MANAEEADRTLFVRNLDSKVTEELLFELFVQAGPLIKTKIPKDKTFGFAVYKHEESVHYAIELLNGTSLYGRSIQVQFRSGSTHGTSPGGISKNSSPANTPNPHGQRMQNQDGSSYSPPQQMQRSFSSPENLQKQVVMNNVWQLQLMQLQQLHRVKAGYMPDLLGQVVTPQMDVDLLQASLPAQKQQQQQYRGGSRGGGGSWSQESSSQRGYRQHPYQDDRGNSSGYSHHSRSQRYSDDSSTGRHQRGQGNQGNQGNHYNHHDDRTGSRSWDSRDNRRRY